MQRTTAQRPHRPSTPETPTHPPDPCRIEGGYAPVPAAVLAHLWTAYRGGDLHLADIAPGSRCGKSEAGLRASEQSAARKPRRRTTRARPDVLGASVQAVEAVYDGQSIGKPHATRVMRQRLRRLAAAGLASPIEAVGEGDRVRYWQTTTSITDGGPAKVLRAPRCAAANGACTAEVAVGVGRFADGGRAGGGDRGLRPLLLGPRRNAQRPTKDVYPGVP